MAASGPVTELFGLVPAEGGFGGETFFAEAAGERTVVRLYVRRGAGRGPEAPAADAAVLRLVRGLLPVPEVLEVRRPDPAAGSPGLLVTSVLPGSRLEEVLPRLPAAGRATVGRHLGVLLARLATMPMLRPGRFLDGDLRLAPLPARDLVEFVQAQRTGTALESWSDAAFNGLLDVAAQAQAHLDGVDRTCLVHGDVNPKNVLVDPETLEVTGLLDWEFAYAGPPGTDLGNLLRFERDPALSEAVLTAVAECVPDAGPDLLDQARAADLLALVDLAARRGENAVAERAHAQLLAVARTGDLHAVP